LIKLYNNNAILKLKLIFILLFISTKYIINFINMINARITSLRKYLTEQGAHAIIIPSNDPHQSEYPPEYWKIREWISGFTGSAGLVAVTLKDAGLWTDSRYFIQAEKELEGTGIKLFKVRDRSAPGYTEWISKQLEPGQNLLVIAELTDTRSMDKISSKLQKKNINVKALGDPFKVLWEARPPLPDDPIYEHDSSFTGVNRSGKINLLREKMIQKDADHLLITALDDIAWTLNLRSSDVECNPVFISYLLISKDHALLFVKESKLNDELTKVLQSDNIQLQSYNSIQAVLEKLRAKDSIMLDKSQISVDLFKSVSHLNIVDAESPAILLKASKNEIEMQCFDSCMIRDGIALVHAFYWLEQNLGQEDISEYDFAMKIAEFRACQKHYRGESFPAIVGYASNGAIVHYRPGEKTSKQIKPEGILLVDCGGQYLDGTTDITRTIALAEPSREQINNYTLVLKGHIALAVARFPEGTSGCQLDTLARQPLWSQALNYSHGTGHGIGFFNSVHEGPQSISPSPSSRASRPILAGMISSNEPGYYKEGAYGIRIENLITCIKSSTEGFLEFKTITLMPIDTRLVDKNLLGQEAVDWLNTYHRKVFESLSPHLDEEHKNWLADKCEEI